MPKFIVLSGKKQAGKTTVANFIKIHLEKQYLKAKEREESIRCSDYNEKHGEFLIPSLVGKPTNLVGITSFAAPIKQFCLDVLGLDRRQIYGTEEQKNTHTNIKWDTMPDEIRLKYGRFLKENEIFGTAQEIVGRWGFTSPKAPMSGYMTAREVMQIFGTDIMRTFFDYDIWAKAPFKKNWGSTEFIIIDDCRFPNEANNALEHKALLIRLLRNPLQDTHASEIAMDDYDATKYDYVIHNATLSLKELDAAIGLIINKRAGFTK